MLGHASLSPENSPAQSALSLVVDKMKILSGRMGTRRQTQNDFFSEKG